MKSSSLLHEAKRDSINPNNKNFFIINESFISLSLDRLSIVNNYKINLEKLHLIDLHDRGHYVVEGVARGVAKVTY